MKKNRFSFPTGADSPIIRCSDPQCRFQWKFNPENGQRKHRKNVRKRASIFQKFSTGVRNLGCAFTRFCCLAGQDFPKKCKLNPAATWVAGIHEISYPKRGKKTSIGYKKMEYGHKKTSFFEKFIPPKAKKTK